MEFFERFSIAKKHRYTLFGATLTHHVPDACSPAVQIVLIWRALHASALLREAQHFGRIWSYAREARYFTENCGTPAAICIFNAAICILRNRVQVCCKIRCGKNLENVANPGHTHI